MTTVTFFLLGLIVGGLTVLVIYARRQADQHATTVKDELVGICASAVESTSRKETRKAQALELLRQQPQLSNAELRQHLGVARRTVVKYMSELEQSGQVEQVGDTGRGVTYRLR